MVEMTEETQAPSRVDYRYGQILRTIGAYLNLLQARYVTIAEIDQGFTWHCYPRANLTKSQSGMVTFEDLPKFQEAVRQMGKSRQGLLRRSKIEISRQALRRHPICPAGYEEMFRTIGQKLDEQRAQQILLVERGDSLIANYRLMAPNYIAFNPNRFDQIVAYSHQLEFQRPQISTLIGAARSFRHSNYFH